MVCPNCEQEVCRCGAYVLDFRTGRFYRKDDPTAPQPAKKSLNIQILGGGSAGERHRKMLTERGHACTVYDPKFASRLLDQPDAVAIASPPETHEYYLQRYWDQCPILCEGPVTWLPQAALGQPHPHMTASNWLFVPAIQELAKRIKASHPVTAHLWFDYDLAKWRGPGWAYKESCYYASGIDLINCHEAMTALWLFGPLTRVHKLDTYTGKSRRTDAVSVVAKHESGVLTTITSSWHSAVYRRGIRVVYADGSSEHLTWMTPQDDAVCNRSYASMLDHWLAAIAANDTNVRPSLRDGYRAYKLMQGEEGAVCI